VGHGDLLACAEFDVSSRLGEIEIPVLVVRGDAEYAALEEQSALLAKTIPGARSVVIPKAGHMLPIEQPEALADATLAFLAEVSS
jgi:pimeloyl-ACP methyl ester carboxylesterase